MRYILIAILIALTGATHAQTCSDIKDVKFKDCHPFVDTCSMCNYPYESGMQSWYAGKVIEFSTKDTNRFIRFYNDSLSYKVGKWVLKEKDILKNGTELPSMEELKDILQLTYVPNRWTIVTIPPGVKILEGQIYRPPGTNTKCRQFCIEINSRDLDPSWFK